MALGGAKGRTLFALTVIAAGVLTDAAAPAQDAPNFFQKLFGFPPAQPRVDASPIPSPTPRRTHRSEAARHGDFVPSTTTRAPAAQPGAAAQAHFHVETIGDSLADTAADGLAEAFAEKPDIGIVNKARDPSGLVRNDYFDWMKFAATDATASDKADYVVILVGINDGQQLRDGADWLDPLTDKWKTIYGARIEAVIAPYAAAHIPVAWVSLPPMRADRANVQAVALNELFREHAEKAGAKFIDIYDAFADQNGQYDAYGPSVEGEKVKLRGSDGIHFTKAGGRKLANFLESEIKRVFEKRNPTSEVAALPPDIEQAADDINAQIRREIGGGQSSTELEPKPTEPSAPTANIAVTPAEPPPRPTAGPILPLTNKPSSSGGVLASRQPRPASEPDPSVRAIRAGSPGAPTPGRADDFAWPKL